MGGNDGTITDGHTLHDDGAMANPGIMANDCGPGALPVKYFGLVRLARPIIARAVHEMVQRGALVGMLAGIDSGEGRHIHKLAEGGIGNVGVAVRIAVIAEVAFNDARAFANLDIAAKGGELLPISGSPGWSFSGLFRLVH